MLDFINETPAGQFLRFLGFQKPWLSYPEEKPGFQPGHLPAIVSETSSSPSEHDLEKTILASEKDVTPGSPCPETEVTIVAFAENDPANPRNWRHAKKMWTLAVVNLYTFCVYCTASIITPTTGAIMKRYDVSIVVASLGLSMYVVGRMCIRCLATEARC